MSNDREENTPSVVAHLKDTNVQRTDEQRILESSRTMKYSERKRALQDHLAKLLPSEVKWSNRYDFLLKQGYQLRQRLRPGWVPSWQGTNDLPYFFEDGHSAGYADSVDAVRISDRRPVQLKEIIAPADEQSYEAEIARFLSSPEMRKDKRNHCCPILNYFREECDSEHAIDYIVMPVLRNMNDPSFYAVDEVFEFVQQTLEGLIFMHEHGVAHLDCAAANIMMDGNSLYPKGFHPGRQYLTPTGNDIQYAKNIRRIHASPVKYYFIDFGLAHRFDLESSDPPLWFSPYGREKAPEQNSGRFNPFLLDIYVLGMVYRRVFFEKYTNVEFLRPIIEGMIGQRPEDRISLQEAMQMLIDAQKSRSRLSLRQRLYPIDESKNTRIRRNIHAVILDGVFFSKCVLRWVLKSHRRRTQT